MDMFGVPFSVSVSRGAVTPTTPGSEARGKRQSSQAGKTVCTVFEGLRKFGKRERETLLLNVHGGE